jgi:long-subunit fatty acid transport protein
VRRHGRIVSTSAVIAIALLCAGPDAPGMRTALATPLDEPHTGGVGFSGPTTGDLAAVHWNPAAISLIEGNQLRLGVDFTMARSTVGREAIDPATGVPSAGGTAFPSVTGKGDTAPLSWPPGPGFFAGFAVNVGGRFNLAIAAYTPSYQQISFSDAGAVTRFHMRAAEIQNFALVPAIAIRVNKRLRVGIAPGFLFSAARLAFDQDTALSMGSAGLQALCNGQPCGAENPGAAARYNLDGGSPFGNSPTLTLAGGIHYQWDRFGLGVSYNSRPIGNDRGGIVVPLASSRIDAPSRDGGAAICPQGRNCITGSLQYRLPDVITLGGSWILNARFSVDASVRFLRFSAHDHLSIRVVAPANVDLGARGIDDRFVIRRGFRDQLDTRGMLVWKPKEAIKLGAGLRITTAAVPAEQVNPGAIDGLSFEPRIAAAVRWHWLTLTAGYALGIIPTVNSDGSGFSPADAVACVDGGRDLRLPSCANAARGGARPTAAGSYREMRHVFGMGVTTHF